MVQQSDVDHLLQELEAMRQALLRDRASVAERLDQLVKRARQMRDDAEGGKFEPAVASVHDLLQSLQRGVTAQDRLNALRTA